MSESDDLRKLIKRIQKRVKPSRGIVPYMKDLNSATEVKWLPGQLVTFLFKQSRVILVVVLYDYTASIESSPTFESLKQDWKGIDQYRPLHFRRHRDGWTLLP